MEVVRIIREMLDDYDPYFHTNDMDLSDTKKYLAVVRLAGEYLIDRPDAEIAKTILERVKNDVRCVALALADSKQPHHLELLEICKRCVVAVEETAKNCGL